MLEIGDYLDRRPGQLSGGQRQRVAIGRAIVRNPTAFLLDEPLSNLDAELRISMRAELSALHKRLKTTMIYVTHDQVEAMTLADRIVVLRKGRLEQVGTPLELYNAPINRFVAGFIGAPTMNFLSGTLVADKKRSFAVKLNGGEKIPLGGSPRAAKLGQEVTLGIRPQQVRKAGPKQIGIRAKLTLVEMLGAETVLHCRAHSGAVLLAILPGQHRLSPGAEVTLNFDAADLHLFDSNGQRIAVN